jgi:iron complex outermembrane recepter protein
LAEIAPSGIHPKDDPHKKGDAMKGAKVAALFVALCISHAAWAQERQFDLSAMDAVHGIPEFARQAGIQIVAPADGLEGISTPAIRGSLDVRLALRKLLVGTDLEIASDDGAVITLRRRAKATKQSGSPQANHGSTTDAAVTATATPRSDSDLSEIVVTAQKQVERLQDVPIMVTVLDGARLDTSTFVSTRDALATVPGMSTLSDAMSGSYQVVLRGVSAAGISSAGSTPIAFYLDGVPVQFVRQAFLPDANVYDLQRIEVLSGPQGTLYGASALNGVINILTADPDLYDVDFKGRSAVSTTDHGGENYDGDMAANIPIIDGKLGMRLVVGSEHESGWIDSILGNHVNDIDIENVRLKLKAQPTDTLSIGLEAWHSQDNAGGPPEADQNYDMPDPYPQPDHNNFNTYNIHINSEFPTFDLTSTTGYISYGLYGVVDFSAGGYDVGIYDWNHNRQYSEELNLTSKDIGPWKWSAGLFYRNDEDYYFANDALDPSPPTFFGAYTDTSKSEAVYGELGRSFLQDTLEISAGARYFHDDIGTRSGLPSGADSGTSSFVPSILEGTIKATSVATTPRAIVLWKPDRDFTAYLSYGQGFRSGIPQTPFVNVQYPSAKPDKLTNYEFGIKGNLFDQMLSYSAAAYYMRWTGVQQELTVYPPSDPAGVLAVLNAGTARGPGADLSLTLRPLTGLEIGGTVSWNNLTFENTIYSGGVPVFYKGNRLNQSPRLTASGSVSYTFPFGASGVHGQFSFSENYVAVMDSIYILPTGPSNYPSNAVAIARGQFTVMPSEHWQISLFADNLTNWNGAITGQDPAYFDIRNPPRTVGMRVDYHLR